MVPIALAGPAAALEVQAPSGRVAATVVPMPVIDTHKEVPKQRLSTGK